MLVYFCIVDGLICKSVLFVASCFSSIQFLLLFQHTFFFHNTLDVILETPFHFFSNYAPLVLPKYDVKLNIKTFTDYGLFASCNTFFQFRCLY